MGSFLDFLAVHRIGLAAATLLAAGLVVLVQWLAWIFAMGRFKSDPDAKPTSPTSPLRFVIADFLVRLINDFRHLLALVLLLVFAATLAAVLTWAKDFAQVKEGLQIVMATLGGLLGSIIGYYFGESSARKSEGAGGAPIPPAVSNQPPPTQSESPPPQPAPKPPV